MARGHSKWKQLPRLHWTPHRCQGHAGSEGHCIPFPHLRSTSPHWPDQNLPHHSPSSPLPSHGWWIEITCLPQPVETGTLWRPAEPSSAEVFLNQQMPTIGLFPLPELLLTPGFPPVHEGEKCLLKGEILPGASPTARIVRNLHKIRWEKSFSYN